MDPPTEISFTAATIENITCANANNGVITVSTNNASGVTYNWTPNVGTGASVNNLSPGTYAVTVSNVDLCTADSSFTLTEPDPIVVVMTDSVGSECGRGGARRSRYVPGGGGESRVGGDRPRPGAGGRLSVLERLPGGGTTGGRGRSGAGVSIGSGEQPTAADGSR